LQNDAAATTQSTPQFALKSNFNRYIYISLQLCKMTDARASHINADQGTIKAQNTKNK
jgi:hypothetical protein